VVLKIGTSISVNHPGNRGTVGVCVCGGRGWVKDVSDHCVFFTHWRFAVVSVLENTSNN
jgi:hypothetical protein